MNANRLMSVELAKRVNSTQHGRKARNKEFGAE